MKLLITGSRKCVRKGVQKHMDDLITIETGIRPEPKKVVFDKSNPLDLPF
jgi:hypothetical protein